MFLFRCTACDSSIKPSVFALRCTLCRAPFGIDYGCDLEWPRSAAGSPLPLKHSDRMITLGEGNTPLISAHRIACDLGLGSLSVKLESANPTGSFKDRGTSVMLNALMESGVQGFVEDSSGNAGASAAAYAARAGIEAHVFVPDSAPITKILQISAFGAEIHRIAGTRELVTTAAQKFVSDTGMAYASHNLSPYFIEGTKSFAYEAFEQMKRVLPDHIVMPVGNGSLFIATYLAHLELLEQGYIDALPKLHAVQSRLVMPIFAAWNDEEWVSKAGRSTIADGIASTAPPRLDQILTALKGTTGSVVAVEDVDISRWKLRLARREGIYGEPTSAAAFAGLEALMQEDRISAGDSVLIPITGSGLKAS